MISARISFLYRNIHLLSFQCRKTLCTALIQPYFDYCCSSWYEGLNKKYKSRLDILQRRMIRLIFRFEPRDHVGQEHLRRLGWFSVADRVRYFKLVHMYKVLSNRAPRYISDSFTRVSDVHNHATRQSDLNFHVTKSDNLGSMSKSFRCSAIREWNILPNSIKNSLTEKNFKAALKAYLLNC